MIYPEGDDTLEVSMSYLLRGKFLEHKVCYFHFYTQNMKIVLFSSGTKGTVFDEHVLSYKQLTSIK